MGAHKMAKGGMVVTSIKDIPNFKQRLDEGKITYRGLGLGKLWDDFNKLTGTTGTRIKVDGKEYFITDEEFNTFSRGADGKVRIRFAAPFKKSYADGGYMADGGLVQSKYAHNISDKSVEDINIVMTACEEDDAALEFNDSETIMYFDENELSPKNRKEVQQIFSHKMAKGGRRYRDGGYMGNGGMIAGRYYKDASGEEYRYLGDYERKENTGVFSDGENVINKSYSEFDLIPKQKKLFGFFEDGGENKKPKVFQKIKIVITDVDMGGDVIYRGTHWLNKDMLASKSNKEIGDYILNKYMLDYGNSYKYKITKTNETREKFSAGGVASKKYEYDVTFTWDSDNDNDYKQRSVSVSANSSDEAEEITKNKYAGSYKGFTIVSTKRYMAKGGSIEKKIKDSLSKASDPDDDLPMEVAIYVPSTDKASVIISKKDFNKRVDEVEEYLSKLYGGYSAVSVEGGYISSDKEKGLIQESVTRVTTFGKVEGFHERFVQMIQKVVAWCGMWGQESMGVEFEGDMFYIKKDFKF
jgi:hypothetical protein